jgi:hypothetical protein
VRFFVGFHDVAHVRHLDGVFISINRLRTRRSGFEVGDWIMDSGAFTEVSKHGGYRAPVAEYAAQIRRWARTGRMLAAVAQDWMCEPFIVKRTGLSVAEHQRLTIERYVELRAADTGGAYVMPVLQGYGPGEYLDHLEAYGALLEPGAWVGVGSVCKRNASVVSVLRVLINIKHERPDLRLHGFGLKSTALAFPPIREMLHTADSMAWSFAARKQGRDGNDWREARDYADRIAAGGGPSLVRV